MSSLLSLCDVHIGLKELRAHLEFEKRRILPLYAERVGSVPGGDPEFFRLREKNILYPRLDAIVTEEERAALLRGGLFAQPPSAGGV